MKKVLMLMSLALIGQFAYSQNNRTMENQESVDTTLSSGALVCLLTGADLIERKSALQKEVFSYIRSADEMDSGYVFHFEDNDELLLKLMDYILAEKKCCPFFRQEVIIKPNEGGISWTVSGPDGAKQMLEMLLKD